MKVAHAVGNSEMFRISSKSFNLQDYDEQAKINIFYQLTLLSNNFVSILLRIMVLLVIGRSTENIVEKKKADRRHIEH